MVKKTKMIILFVFIAIVLIVAVVAGYFYIGKAKVQDNITWGVDFSQSQAEYLGLKWKDVYLAVINDLGAKNIKLHTNWDWVEGKKGNYFFKDIDWQIKQAEQNNVKVIYVLGMKTGRWPECHAPLWAQNLSVNQQQTELLKYVTEVVTRYKDSKAIVNWQVENEPLFNFGECPAWYYKNEDFLKTEVALVKSLDPKRQIIISDSGEQSTWFDAAKVGDIVGITMYRNVWASVTETFGFNATYAFLTPTTYARKIQLIKQMFKKDVICIELQAEPWTKEPLMRSSLEDQLKSMNPEIFKENVQFAKNTGLNKFYFWGAEWWYWLKTEKNQPAIWDEAKKLFQ
jgi:hypothetical protein